MEYLIAAAAVVYMVLGFGVWRMWRIITDDDNALAVVLLWPLVLLTTAFTNRAG